MSAVLPDEPLRGAAETPGPELMDLLAALLVRWKRVLLLPLAAGLLALGATYLVPKTFTATTMLLPPQQQQSATASALAQLSALSGLAGVGAVRTPGDQYVALLRSRTVADRLIETFELMKVYNVELRFEAREKLARRVRVSLGRKDGMIAIEVDDHDPQRAAAMANAHVEELRRLTSSLALTEAQQRRAFLEKHLEQTRERLTAAQRELQGGGFNPGALKADARVAAETYARLRAEATAAEIRLQALRERLADATPEIQQLLAQLRGLRGRVAQAEVGAPAPEDGDYIGRYREFKYQETLFDLFARQYELARLDESREGALIQVVDVAVTPEHKSHPRRGMIAVATTLGTGLLVMCWILLAALSARRTGPSLGQRLTAARRAAGG